jgi:phosphoribosylamine-glycine ligase
VLEVQILEAVVEQEGVGAEFLDGEEAALHAILVDEHDDVFEVVREHVRLVARGEGIEEAATCPSDTIEAAR